MVKALGQNDRLDAAIAKGAERAFGFLERLVAEPSVLGDERGAQRVLADELERLGFGIEWMPIPAAIAEDPLAGVPPLPYDGSRAVLVAQRPGADPAAGRSLLINGHLDVVPSGEPRRWASDPFAPARRDGWLHGRGAGDMKAGLAMAALAVEALHHAGPPPAGDLMVVGVIEEECTGNGTLASVRAGVGADAVVLPEPTDLYLLVRGNGVLWLDVRLDGPGAHAEAEARESALDGAWTVVRALRDLAGAFEDGAPDGVNYNANVGILEAGDWPSTVPSTARLRVRIGFPAELTPAAAEARVREAIAAADGWLAEHPPVVTPSGFRAEGYALDGTSPLARALAAAHADVHGAPPRVVGTNGTTDARYYLNQAGTPAICYGPRTRGMHGVDEAVELASIADGARVLARFMAGWMNGGEA